jgi:5-hydroxyisourate hydrolase
MTGSLTMPQLTTHVLDTAAGKPAAGMRIVLRHADNPAVLAEGVTNADGRLERALLAGDAFRPGIYELSFHVGDYFRDCGQVSAEPVFLDVVPVRVGLAAGRDYHVPLLISPYGYSTYRGS